VEDLSKAIQAQRLFAKEFLDENLEFKKQCRRLVKEMRETKAWEFLTLYLQNLQVQKGLELLVRASEKELSPAETAFAAGIVRGFQLVLNLPGFVEEAFVDQPNDSEDIVL